MEKITIKKLIAATYSVDNSADAGRQFAISADVNTVNGHVQGIQNGRVTEIGGDAPQQLADFTDHGNLSSNIYDTSVNVNRTDVFAAISQFCSELRNGTIE